MKLTRCPKVPYHFYDAAKNESCPFCAKQGAAPQPGAPAPASPQSSAPPVYDDEFTLIGDMDEAAAPIRNPALSTRGQAAPSIHPSMMSAPEVTLHGDAENREPSVQIPAAGVSLNMQSAPAEPKEIAVETETVSRKITYTQQEVSQRQEEAPAPMAPQASAFAQAVAENRSTVGNRMPNPSGRTIAVYDDIGTEPVVGWLVCVKGTYAGESFNLKAGQNFIGRSLGMDIALLNEGTVSREFHAVVIFEPVEMTFFVAPGQSSGLTYLNRSLVMTPTPLHDFDVLQLGKAQFVFRSLCGEQFQWENYMDL